MAIYAPGIRDRHNRRRRSGARSAVAMLSLTAMVDMFTVLVVFLLQNFSVDAGLLELDDSVELPRAHEVKELKPAHVVVVSKQNIMVDSEVVASFNSVREQQEWMINNLHNRLVEKFKEAADKRKLLGLDQIKQAVDQTKQGEEDISKPEDDRRITVQADKTVDFLTIKKVMMTITEAGASEINFAVLKTETLN